MQKSTVRGSQGGSGVNVIVGVREGVEVGGKEVVVGAMVGVEPTVGG